MGRAPGDGTRAHAWAIGLVVIAIAGSTVHASCGRVGFDINALSGDASLGSAAGARIGAGSGHTCVVLDTGAVRCWGQNFAGQTGAGNTTMIGDDEPASAALDVPLGGLAVEIAVGGHHTCARLEDGAVRCWGVSWAGHTGYGTETVGDDETPASKGNVSVGGAVAKLEAGGSHSCAILTTDKVQCWGYNAQGQLGYGTVDFVGDDELPAAAGNVQIGRIVEEIAGGSLHTCARLGNGRVRCWGANDRGQLGTGNTVSIGDDEFPNLDSTDVALPASAIAISAGNSHTCAVLTTGEVYCWGTGGNGALGYGNLFDIGDNEPVESAGPVQIGWPAVDIACGQTFSCALRDTGAVKCWGSNLSGELGTGTTDTIGDDELPSSIPDVEVGGVVRELAANYQVCALLDTGALRCWGPGPGGALGYGSTENIGDDETPASAGDVPYL